MKKRNLLLVILAVLLVFGLVVGCGPADDEDGTTKPGGGGTTTPTAVTFSNATANGSATTATTQLTLTFSRAITGLSATDITITGVTVTKGTLVASGTNYTLPISGFAMGGSLEIEVSKTGYNISPDTKTVTIYGPAEAFLNSYITTYTLNGVNTNEKVTIDKTTFKIDEIQNNVIGDHIYFSITKWDLADVPTWTDASYPSTGGSFDFTIGFKLSGKITEARAPGSATTPPYGTGTALGFVGTDVNTTDCWVYIYLDEDGDYLVRSMFSKSTTTGAAGNNGTGPVKGTNGAVRCYQSE